MQRPPVIFPKTKSKSKSQRRSRRRRRQNKQQQHTKEILSTSPSVPSPAATPNAGSRLWLETYENIVKWQAEHQASYWKNLAQKLKTENEELKDKLRRYEPKNDDGSESSSSEDAEELMVDEEYLDFMEVTRKHQESMRLLRAGNEGGDPKASDK